MRVGFNALHLVPGETGGSELYARRLVETLVGGQHEVEATVFVGHEGANSDWPDPVQLVEVPVHARSRPARVLAEQTLLPRAEPTSSSCTTSSRRRRRCPACHR